jgi:hypothetical protein
MRKGLTALAVAGIIVASAVGGAASAGSPAEKNCPGFGGQYWANWLMDLLLGRGINPGDWVRDQCLD